MYRALDLTVDIVEHAGTSVLPLGHLAEPDGVLAICLRYGANTLSGDTSQLIKLASYVESSKTRKDDTADFIFDTRNMIVDVMPLDFDLSTRHSPCRVVEGEMGVLIATSLQRLRNPLVRYVTGDIGSIHPLPPSASSQLGQDAEHLRVLRLHGRDTRSSFKWEGEYFELDKLSKLMSTPAWGILRWQIVLTSDQASFDHVEIRLICATGMDGLVALEEIEAKLKRHFYVDASSGSLFHVNIRTPDDFIRSETGNKVIKVVDRRGKKK
ncbi:hypothetical protein VE02_09880 [Pseudogymnoascus sp. 03VT05]|nr:hypothetical protein VE02_09880 [Pseudogymnoascus sp. 03VT05]